MRPSNRYILVFTLLLAIAVGCDTVAHEEAEPPELIPARAFVAQTELFQRSQSGKATIGPHFMAAVMRAWPVSTTLDTRLLLPAILTRAALDEEPTVEDGAWVWSSTVSISGQPVAFTLTGKPMGDQVDWTMEIASPEQSRTSRPWSEPSYEQAAPSPDTAAAASLPVFSPDTTSSSGLLHPSDSTAADSATHEFAGAEQQDRTQDDVSLEGLLPSPAPSASSADSTFVLYTAQTDFDGQEGSWRLYDIEDGERTNVLNASFKIEKATKKEITFSIPVSVSEHGGDSVVYAHDGDQHRLRWVRAREGQTYRLTWNAQSQEGAITATNYNGGQTACWSKHLDNVACSSK